MSYLGLSTRIARYLATRTGTSVPEAVLEYAVEVLFLNVLNVSTALLLASWVGVLPETTFALGTVAVLRFFAGGAHNASPALCAAVTSLVFPLLGIAARRLVASGPALGNELLAATFLLGLLAMVAFAPVDSPAAPIISRQRRTRLRAGSIVAIVLLAAIASALGNDTLQVSLSLGILWSAFIITPAGHKLFRFIDSLSWPRGGGEWK